MALWITAHIPNRKHEKSSWYPARNITPSGYHSCCWQVLCTLEEKSNHQYCPDTNPVTYNNGLPAWDAIKPFKVFYIFQSHTSDLPAKMIQNDYIFFCFRYVITLVIANAFLTTGLQTVNYRLGHQGAASTMETFSGQVSTNKPPRQLVCCFLWY